MEDQANYASDDIGGGSWTMSTNGPLFTANQQMRMEAVQRAVELYNGKPTPNLKDLNEKFKELYTEIYNFYVTK